jgi:hypothetical protein
MAIKTLPINPNLPPPTPIGTVIALPGGTSPNVLEFHCILQNLPGLQSSAPTIRHGQYALCPSIEGLVIGRVDHVQISNTYFQDAHAIKNFAEANLNLRDFFPSDRWECMIAQISVLGLVPEIQSFSYQLSPSLFRRLEKPGFPVKPGNNVYRIEGEFLSQFLGFDDRGLNIGEMKHYGLQVKPDINRLFNKHLAILAQSGAGKSYLLSVLLEELLMRDEKLGRPACVLFDVHGEYRYMSERLDPSVIPDLKRRMDLEECQRRIQHYSVSFLQIGVPNLNEYDFQRFQPGISLPQLRVLRKALDLCRKQYCMRDKSDNSLGTVTEGFDLKDLIFMINDDAEINSKVKETLVGWLVDLDRLGIFGKNEAPSVFQMVKAGQLAILDLSTMTSMRKKQMLIHYFTSRIFHMRRSGYISPFILFLEEAHNFIPENGGSNAIAKGIFETIAREGRKFFAQLVLVSQRPVHLSTTVLSQCNTQLIMRVTNPFDLDHIKKTSEMLTAEGVRLITTLPVGTGMIVGSAVNYPVFVKVRQRMIPNIRAEISLAEMCLDYQRKEFPTVATGVSVNPATSIDEELIEMDFSANPLVND